MLKIVHVVGARPNFVKVAPIMSAMAERQDVFQQILVHTGQHYDYNMSRVFFDELAMPDPDEYLGVGSGSHAAQTARVMLAFEETLQKHQPDWVFVVGDVNSTLACSLVSAKLGVPVAHVEAGLRSRDRSMPEELNRLLTDQLSDLLFTPSLDGNANLLQENIPQDKIAFVGNVMIDTLVKMLPKAQARPILHSMQLEPQGFFLVTLHRPSNVDHPETLSQVLSALQVMGQELPVVFPVHPRTRKAIESLGPDTLRGSDVRLVEPLGYLDFLALTHAAALVLTDSGGVQEETAYLGVPCLTARPNTERPVTLQAGTNRLVESTRPAILAAVSQHRSARLDKIQPIEYWDGHAAERIVKVMLRMV